MSGVENIGKKDVVWSYLATIFMVGTGVLLLPFVLNKMPAETVGVWNIFTAITALVNLLDFGFRPSFARNITYILSGVKQLQKEGVQTINGDGKIDYSLLSGTINAMRRFYGYMSLIVFFLLISAGTIYFLYILEKYEGDRQDAIAAWILLVIISCYNLYTFYYDALLIGKGYVKRDQQFTIISQSAYLLIAIILIFSGFGLTAIVCSKLISIIIRRYLSYKTFFTDQMKSLIKSSIPSNDKEILKIITPNAAKVGVTNLGGFLVNKSAFFIGAAYLSLEEIASFGITLHIIDLISNCGNVVYKSYLPKLAECRANSNNESLRKLFIICCGMMILVYILGGLSLLLFGDWVIELIGSKTPLLASGMILAMLTISYLECNHSMASGFISADNRIPFFIPSILSGGLTILLLWLFVCKFSWALWGMILAPGIAQFVYQNWKWPSVVIKELFVEGNIK